MARVKKAATKKRAVKKTMAKRGRPAVRKKSVIKLDPTKNSTFKAAVARREKSANVLMKAEAALKSNADALIAARKKSAITKNAATRNVVAKRVEMLEKCRSAVANAKHELKMAEGMVAALAKFDARQQKSYERELNKTVADWQRNEDKSAKKLAAPKKKRRTKRLVVKKT